MKEERDTADDRRSFRFSHVRLKPEQQIVLHQQPTWELSYVVCGEGERIVGDTHEPFRSGEVVLIVPQMSHCWKFDPAKTDAEGKIENITITFSNELLETTARDYPEARPVIERLRKLPGSILFIRQTAQRLASLMTEMLSQPPSVQLFMLLQIVMLIATSEEHKVVGHSALSPTEQRLRNIEVFVVCNFRRQITLTDLAQYVGVNQTALCKFLKRNLGKTFIQYLTDFRMAEAKTLLRQSAITISEVCYHSGFNDVPHFCRVFKKAEGMTPKEYRALKTTKRN